jgi:TatD DNase family protein
MAPVPHRGKRNEPGWVVHVAEALAGKLERSLEDVVAMTDRAAGGLYGFPLGPPPGR